MLIKIPTDVMAEFKKVYERRSGQELKKLLEYSEAVENVMVAYISANEIVSEQIVEEEMVDGV